MHPRHLAAFTKAVGDELHDPRIARRLVAKYARAAKRKARHHGKTLPPLARNPKLQKRTVAGVKKLVAGILEAQRAALGKALTEASKKFMKALDDDVQTLIADILATGWNDAARRKLLDLLAAQSSERAAAAMAQLKPYLDDDAYAAAVTQANERAVEWARDQTTNMITNVNDTTRQIVNELTASALEDGLTNAELADTLAESFGFSESRSETIARTETAFADVAGTLAGYRASGVVAGKQWSADDQACDECADLDGVVVDLEDDFPDGGGDGPPRHPNCECSVAPVLSADAASLIVED